MSRVAQMEPDASEAIDARDRAPLIEERARALAVAAALLVMQAPVRPGWDFCDVHIYFGDFGDGIVHTEAWADSHLDGLTLAGVKCKTKDASRP